MVMILSCLIVVMEGGKNVYNDIVDGSTTDATATTTILVHKGKGLLVKHETQLLDNNNKIMSVDDNNKIRKIISCNDEIKLFRMKWTLGVGEDGTINALILLELIRDKRKMGSDVAINWIDGFSIDASGILKS